MKATMLFSSMSKSLKYDQVKLRTIVKECETMRQVAIALNLNESGGTFLTLRKKIAEWEIDISHFVGKSFSKGKPSHNSVSLQDILENKIYIRSQSVKNKLIKAGIFKYQCMNSKCNLKEWLGNTLVLELDHIDGNRKNNNLVNLRLLCPNCHSQTSTWRGRRNKK